MRRRSWLIALLAPLLAAGMLYVVSGLREQAVRAADARVILTETSAEFEAVERLSARMLLTAGSSMWPGPIAAVQLETFRDRARRQYERLAEVDPESGTRLAPNRRAMDALLTELVAALRAGTPESPALMQRAIAILGDSQAEVERLTRERREEAQSARVRADLGTALAVVGGTIAFLFLFWRFDRIRRREARRTAEQLRYLADHDALTLLPNRRRLKQDLDALAGHSDAEAALVALFDLNGFKAYNDRLGHHAGDDLLARVAARFVRAAGPHGNAYRLGGDEFCAVLVDGDLEDGIRRCRAALDDGESGMSVSAACGWASLEEVGGDPSEALRLADSRLYEEKGARVPVRV